LQGTAEHRLTPPPGLVTMRISAETGRAARPDDENAMFETFIEGHLPPPAEDVITGDPAEGAQNEPSSSEPLF